MAINDQNMIDDPEKREKLKKMIEGLDSKGMDRAMDAVMNYSGGSTYKIYGDTDPDKIDFSEDYTSEGGLTFTKKSMERQGGGSGGMGGATNWAVMLIDVANRMGQAPPEKFWFDGTVYDLPYTEEPIYETQKYTVQVPNPEYRAPSSPTTPVGGVTKPGKTPPKAPPSKTPPKKDVPQFINKIKTRQVQTGTEYALSDDGVATQTF
jgi:hypothetical protein